VAERVLDAPDEPTVFLRHGRDLLCAEDNRACEHCGRVVDDEEQPHGRPTERLGAVVPVRRRLVVDPEARVADGELRNDARVVVRAADAVQLGGAERVLVELDRLAAAADRELR
jgi:hypothetical protein